VTQNWQALYDEFPQFQFALVEPGTDEIVAVGDSIPLAWEGRAEDLPDTGWDWALVQGLYDNRAGREPTVLCGLQLVVALNHRGKGISSHAVRAMKTIAKPRGFDTLVIPARPTGKSEHPHVPTEEYIGWKWGDGLPHDPWLRVHVRLGAEIVKVCSQSMRITGTVAEWERWTEMQFPTSGDYVVSGALVPVTIDLDADLGTYIEPNVWVRHRL
jgi:GNAT superfamily N-acetyltransferase